MNKQEKFKNKPVKEVHTCALPRQSAVIANLVKTDL